MKPLRFGGATGELFGVLHREDRGVPPGAAVLLCNPFGQEAIRSHRVYRVLAARIARAGIPSLRFDYGGTGDSDGDGGDISLDHWIDDVLTANRALRRMTGCRSTCWLGLGLGASVAAMASSGAMDIPDRLILWDPVFDGVRWLDELAVADREAMAHAFVARSPVASARSDDEGPAEAVGFELPAPFRRGVSRISPSRLGTMRTHRLAWILSDPVADAVPSDLLEPPAVGSATVHRVAASNWNTDEAMNASIVPADVVAAVIEALEGAGS